MPNLQENRIIKPRVAAKSKILVFSAILLLAGLAVFLLFSNISLKSSLKELEGKKEIECKKSLQLQKASIKKDLEEKYAADMVSFQALAKRARLERQRLRELERQVRENTTHSLEKP
jgi:hypothetical protein